MIQVGESLSYTTDHCCLFVRHFTMSQHLSPALTLAGLEPSACALPSLPNELRIEKLAMMNCAPLAYVPDSCMPVCVDSDGNTDPASLVRNASLSATIRDGVRFRAIFSMTVAEFVVLHARLKLSLSAVRAESRGAGIDNVHSHPLLTTAEQLLLWLFYLKVGTPSALMLVFTDLSRRTIKRYIDHVTDTINHAWDLFVQWPDAEERANLHGSFTVANGAIGVMDGTHCEISKPVRSSRPYRAGHKKKYTQNYLCVVNVFGLVTYISGPYSGSTNDRSAWRESSLFTERHSHFAHDELLLADGGFVGGKYLLCPIHVDDIRRSDTAAERQSRTEWNNDFGKDRALVEDAFAWIKSRAPILGRRYKRHRDRQADAVYAVCRWWNGLRQLRMNYAISQL